MRSVSDDSLGIWLTCFRADFAPSGNEEKRLRSHPRGMTNLGKCATGFLPERETLETRNHVAGGASRRYLLLLLSVTRNRQGVITTSLG